MKTLAWKCRAQVTAARQYVPLVLVAGLVGMGGASCTDESEPLAPTTLSAEEGADLTFLREEEKLARDVYVFSYSQHALPIFQNISQSEEDHMAAVLRLLNSYTLPDPAAGRTGGEFQNATLQTLYDDLTQSAATSLIAALRVGATIEDLDIRDLQVAAARTLRNDLLQVYANLECGSRNHLRSFVGQLDARGQTYDPQYITEGEFDMIVSSGHEACGQF